jgi:hypothetical protein
MSLQQLLFHGLTHRCSTILVLLATCAVLCDGFGPITAAACWRQDRPTATLANAGISKCLWSQRALREQLHRRPLRSMVTRYAVIDDNNNKEATIVDINELELLLKSCTSATRARQILTNTLGSKSLYQSLSIPAGASQREISDGDLAIQTRLVNRKYSIMDVIDLSGDQDADRTLASVLVVLVASTAAALVANQLLLLMAVVPEILRFVVVWLCVFMPLAYVGYGIRDAPSLQSLLVQVQRQCLASYRIRMIQHEAGHFLMGHLLGWPIQGYSTNAVQDSVSLYPLADADVGRSRAKQLGFDRPTSRMDEQREYDYSDPVVDVPYFSRDGRGRQALEQQSVFRNAKNYTANPFLQIAPQDEPSNAWPYRGFSTAAMDQLVVISVAGVCAEILALGNAEGGRADFTQLRQIFNSAEQEMSEREMDNRIRFALGYTMSTLRRHLGVLDELAAVMDRGGSVAECIVAIEMCSNVSGQDGVLGDYELRRREKFRMEGLSPLERLLLNGIRTIDTEEDRFMEGRGGGPRRAATFLTGDDPLYLALTVAGLFLLWAFSGGLTLH